MPKVKPLSQSIACAETVRRNIRTRMTELDISSIGKLGEKMGYKRTAFHYYLEDPRRMRLEQLLMLAQILKVSLVWLITDHSSELR